MPAYATPLLLVVAIFTALSFLPVSLFDVYANKNTAKDSQADSSKTKLKEKNKRCLNERQGKYVNRKIKIKKINC